MDMTPGKKGKNKCQKGFGREKTQLSKLRRRWVKSVEMVGRGMEK
jgi:hypothetical protein